MSCDFKKLADSLADELIANGFRVHRYDAYSSKSVYLKLDCGACNSIRISDHKGYRHLKYRYNIGSWIKKRRSENDTYPRHYFPVNDASALVRRIVRDRDAKIKRFGIDQYRSFVRDGEKQGKSATCGFWSQATEVKGKAVMA